MDACRLVLLLICFSATLSSSSSVASTGVALREEAEKVKLTVYYESLCPYCSNFIVNYLVDIFEEGIAPIVDLKLVPFGNAKIRPNGTITCQHGPWECLLNTIEACAMDAWPDVNVHFRFILCVESLVHHNRYTEWETCFANLHLDPKPVTECYSNGHGTKLELQYATETNSLEPPHKYVPWVVVNGRPLYDDYEYYVNYVCRAYRGPTVPRACLRCLRSPDRTPKDGASPASPVSFRDETTAPVLSEIRLATGSRIHLPAEEA